MAYTQTKKVQISIPIDKADIEIENQDDQYEPIEIHEESRAYLVIDGALEVTAWEDDEDRAFKINIERGHLSATSVGVRII